MAKLIVLRLIGTLQQGYEITLEISEEGQRPYAEETGQLPSQPALAEKLAHHWRDQYRSLVAPYRRHSWTISDFSPASDTEFTPRLKPKKIAYEGSVNARIRACRESAQELQTLFIQWLDSADFRTIDKCLRTHLHPGEISRFLIRTDDRQLQKLPWHTWDLFQTFETEPSFGVSRLQRSPKVSIPTDKRSVKILAILGHSEGIDVAEDEVLLQKLAPDTQFLVEPTREDITERLWAQPWDIIFFAGHSETEGDTGKIYINPNEYLTVDELWYGLRKAVENGLQVAIFNSCDGLGLAHQLMNDFQIPHLIVMRELVPDQVAQQFLKYFLSAFEGGRPFHLAAREARERLQGLEGQFPCASWLPTVYQNPLDQALYWQELIEPALTEAATNPSAKQTIAIEPMPSNEPMPSDVAPVRNWTWQTVQQVAATGLLVTSLVMGGRWLGLIEPVELVAFDHLMRMRPTEPLDANLLLVEATPAEAENIEVFGYPIPDAKVAELLAKLQDSGPIAIGLMSQRRQQWGSDRDREQLINEFNENPNLVTICSAHKEADQLLGAPEELTLKQQQQQVGFGDFYPDPDGHIFSRETVRRQVLEYNPNFLTHASPCISGTSLSLQLSRRFLHYQDIEETVANRDDVQFGDHVLQRLPKRSGGYQSLDGYSNQLMINYLNTQGAPATTVTVQAVMAGEVKPTLIQDRIVIVGTNNPNVVEPINTPYGEMPPMYVQAHMVSNLIQQVMGDRPAIWAFSLWGDALIVLGATLLGGTLAISIRSAWRLGLISGAILLGWYQVCLFTLTNGGWMPLIPVIVAVAITVGIVKYLHGRFLQHNHHSS